MSDPPWMPWFGVDPERWAYWLMHYERIPPVSFARFCTLWPDERAVILAHLVDLDASPATLRIVEAWHQWRLQDGR